ncbi:MAG TPA: LysM peptidoglycan-binding domain-containing protein [Gemmatimonadaceae bacterium]|nr:LysM peptidoglycan-binding domain-containing protein [Gemmatimonadaceae bacterium]
MSAPRRARVPAATGRPWHRLRRALRWSAWTIVLVAGAAATIVLLVVHRGDADGSVRLANRELGYLVQPGERILERVAVRQRHWYHYFRVEHGVLASTDRRLLYVGVPPEPLLPREPEPPELDEAVFRYEQPLDVDWRSRTWFPGSMEVQLVAPRESRRFAITTSQRARMDAVLAVMAARQAGARAAAEAERQQELANAVAVRQPRYHLVARGDALELIGQANDTPVASLVEWNALDGPRIRIGQRLLVKPWS